MLVCLNAACGRQKKTAGKGNTAYQVAVIADSGYMDARFPKENYGVINPLAFKTFAPQDQSRAHQCLPYFYVGRRNNEIPVAYTIIGTSNANKAFAYIGGSNDRVFGIHFRSEMLAQSFTLFRERNWEVEGLLGASGPAHPYDRNGTGTSCRSNRHEGAMRCMRRMLAGIAATYPVI